MTTHRKRKAAVRARMEKTGERYEAALTNSSPNPEPEESRGPTADLPPFVLAAIPKTKPMKDLPRLGIGGLGSAKKGHAYVGLINLGDTVHIADPGMLYGDIPPHVDTSIRLATKPGRWVVAGETCFGLFGEYENRDECGRFLMAYHEDHPESFGSMLQKGENTGYAPFGEVSFEWGVAGIFDASHTKPAGLMDGMEECADFPSPFMLFSDPVGGAAWGVAGGVPLEDAFPVQVVMDATRRLVVGILIRFIDPPCDLALPLPPLKSMDNYRSFKARGGRGIEDFLQDGDRIDLELVDVCRQLLHDDFDKSERSPTDFETPDYIAVPKESEEETAALRRMWFGWVYKLGTME